MTTTPQIPSRLIQTARSRQLSSIEKASATNLRLLHPGWDHRFFDDADIRSFIAKEFPEYQTAFDAFPRPIQRIDFFRYLAVYRYGGFYFDLDVFLSTSLEPLRSHGCVFPFEEISLNSHLRQTLKTDWEIGNYAFGAAPGHPFLLKIIENCVRSQTEPSWLAPMMAGIPSRFRDDFTVLNSTGPGLITRTLAEEPALAKQVAVLFPTDVRDENHWHHFGDFGVHQMNASWRTKGSFLRRKLALLWEARVRKRLLPISHALGQSRTNLPVRLVMGSSSETEMVIPR